MKVLNFYPERILVVWLQPIKRSAQQELYSKKISSEIRHSD
ncbi:hypothetical protein PSE_0808 [Pseudovibrio sp. FO-BEG1]|nr:hypothetical protein PSE_0808 [Pseudovibrio sp. FO-BEG1]